MISRASTTAAAICSVVLAGCGARPDLAPPVADRDRIAIVASERGPRGARLVAIDEHGDRQFELLVPVTGGMVRDASPAISPDRKWMAFVSTRDRSLDQTSLWVAPLGVETTPVRLTTGDWIDSHPVWTRDGRAIVFASTRDGGDFDLWELAIDRGRAVREPTQLTNAPSHEVTPTIGVTGTIVYAAVTPRPGNQIESRLEERAIDGTIRTLTEGPADGSPAFSPDGETIVFARRELHAGEQQSELWRMPSRDARNVVRLVELPMTDESGPVWSADGRFVFATSVLLGADRKPLFSSVVHVDVRESPVRVRMLNDRSGAIARFTPAVATTTLDVPALRGDPEYLRELAKIMAQAIEKAKLGSGETPR